MSFTTFTNIITILFCLAVLVQSVRMMRSLRQVRNARLDDTVLALNTATAQAQTVLSGLRETLKTEGAATAGTISHAKELREELNMLIGIANAMAERLVDAASTNAEPAKAPAEAAPKRKAAPRTTRKTTRRKPAAAKATTASAGTSEARETA